MQPRFAVLIGLLIAGVLFGVWWITLLLGIVALVWRPSYIVLIIGVFADLWYMPGFGTGSLFWSYTLVFFLVAVVTEFLRRRLVWSV